MSKVFLGEVGIAEQKNEESKGLVGGKVTKEA